MLQITNPNLYDFEVTIAEKENGLKAALINVMINPKDIMLTMYKRAPFASFVLTNQDDIYAVEAWKNRPDKQEKIAGLMNDTSYLKLSTFIDQGYHYYETLFASEPLHTMIFEQTSTLEPGVPRLNLVLIAQPVHGMVHPIHRQIYHKMYNGAMVSTTRMFVIKGQHVDESLNTAPMYNRIIYLLVEIKAHFEFNEFFQYGEKELHYACALRRYMTNSREHVDIIPIYPKDYPDVNDLFGQQKGNLFNLSDIPKEILPIKMGDTMKTKMTGS